MKDMTKRKTTEEFVSQISGRPLELIGEYKTAHEKHLFRCKACGNKWRTCPSVILAGYGCPECGRKKMATSKLLGNKVLQHHKGWIEVDVSTPTNPNAIMKIDRADYDAIIAKNHRRIYACRNGSNVYARIQTDGRRVTCIHSLLLSGAECIDHKNHDGLDNRRKNIRACTLGQNLWNTNGRGNEHGHRGIYKNPSGSWGARIGVKGKTIRLGVFTSKEDAINARLTAERKHYGQFAYRD